MNASSPLDDVPIKTLGGIEALLRVYWSPEYAVELPCNGALNWAQANCLVERVRGVWEVTERGKVYVEAIRELPLPEEFTEWRMPR